MRLSAIRDYYNHFSARYILDIPICSWKISKFLSTSTRQNQEIDMAAEALRSSCRSILTATVNHRIGFPILPPANTSTTESHLRSLLSHNDQNVLSAYDKLQELTLERNRLEAEVEALQDALANDSMDVDDDGASLGPSKQEARATQGKLLIRDFVVSQMLSTRPTVRAVHSGPNRTKLETELLPLLTTRDLLATTLLQLTAQLSSLQHTYTTTSSSLIKLTNTNQELAERVRRLVAANEFTESITSSERVIKSKADMMKEQRRCETLKGVVQGIIVGSGVNWADDDLLRRLVLECGND